jgi:transposase
MDIITFINSLTNEDFNRIRNSKSDAEARRLLREHQALQLQQTGVSGSVCCDNQNISWDKHTISIDDKNGSYKDLSFNYCENCGQTFNVEFQ